MQKPYAKRLHDHQCVLSSPEQKPSRQWGHYIGSENRSSEIRWKQPTRSTVSCWNLESACRQGLHAHYLYLIEQIIELESELNQSIKADATAQRIMTIPGVGPMTASLLSSQLGDGKQFSCSRDFAASTGLVPRQYSTGGKSTLLGISKRGDKNLRRLLVQCARSFMMRLEHQQGRLAEWVRKQLDNKHSNIVACALANKLAQIARAITTQQTEYQAWYRYWQNSISLF